MSTILPLILALPFLLIPPGWFITMVFFPRTDRIEKSALSVLLSMLIVYTSLFAVEKTAGKLTPFNTGLTIVIVNLICAVIFIVARSWQSKRH